MSSRRGTAIRAAVGLGLAAFVALSPALSDAQTVTTEPQPFAAATSSSALSMLSNIPGAIGSAQIVNLGFPAAKVVLDNGGTSNAIAALPDPGDIIGGGTGLVSGLLALGAYGLPPIELPTLPDYPLQVSSDATGQPDATLGSGPYSLAADSATDAGTADAIGGLANGPLGNGGLIRATSTVVTKPNGSVVATGVGVVEAITIGPLSIGQIQSTARMTLDANGTLTPYSKILIRGLGVGGLGIDVETDKLTAAGVPIPIDVGKAVNTLLKPSGIKLAFKPGTVSANEVTSPALVITFPVPAINGVSSGAGTFTVTVGNAIASIQASTDDGTSDDDFGDIPAGSDVLGDGLDLGVGLGGDLAPSLSDGGLTSTPRITGPHTSATPLEPWSVRALYLTFGVGGPAAYALMHILRLVGATR